MMIPNGPYADLDSPAGHGASPCLLTELVQLRELRWSAKCSRQALSRLEEQGQARGKDSEAERAYLDSTYREIQRLEKKLLYSEFGFL